MLELWGMRSTPSLSSLLGPLCLGVVAPNMVLSMNQIELFDISTVYVDISTECKQMSYIKLNCLK